jgi:ribosomal protein S18 acetylase RimI-like enzyme
MSWSLALALDGDVDELMSWFPDAQAVDIWGGPRFRYPFDGETFREDCRLDEFSSYCLWTPGGDLAGFGQVGDRYDRAHFARLVANPAMRGQGVGSRLVEMMIGVVRQEGKYSKLALFVYKDNGPASRCYSALGFEVQEYPHDAPLKDRCLYLVRETR